MILSEDGRNALLLVAALAVIPLAELLYLAIGEALFDVVVPAIYAAGFAWLLRMGWRALRAL